MIECSRCLSNNQSQKSNFLYQIFKLKQSFCLVNWTTQFNVKKSLVVILLKIIWRSKYFLKTILKVYFGKSFISYFMRCRNSVITNTPKVQKPKQVCYHQQKVNIYLHQGFTHQSTKLNSLQLLLQTLCPRKCQTEAVNSRWYEIMEVEPLLNTIRVQLR